MSEGHAFSTPAIVFAATPEEVAAARRTVAHHVRDPEELREILDMLGLLGGDES